MEEVKVDIKPSHKSKINWVAWTGALVMLILYLLQGQDVQVPQAIKDGAGELFAAGLLLLISLLRSWFTTKITRASAKKLM